MNNGYRDRTTKLTKRSWRLIKSLKIQKIYNKNRKRI